MTNCDFLDLENYHMCTGSKHHLSVSIHYHTKFFSKMTLMATHPRPMIRALDFRLMCYNSGVPFNNDYFFSVDQYLQCISCILTDRLGQDSIVSIQKAPTKGKHWIFNCTPVKPMTLGLFWF